MEATEDLGVWLMSPRNEEAVGVITDGRWKIDPHPVNWQILPKLAAPVAFRKGHKSDLNLVVMARPDDCFAVSTPCKNESHYSLYLSLIGRDLVKDHTVRVHTRLLVAAELSEKEIIEKYHHFLKEIN